MLHLQEKKVAALQSSRRHLIRIGAIAGPALLATTLTTTARAGDFLFFHWGKKHHHPDDDDDNGGRPDYNCFLKGTTIRTADGDRKVEELSAGDLLPSVFGGTHAIQWVGRYSFTKGDPAKGWVRGVQPIRIARSALGDNVPHADLYVTQNHSVLVDGILVAAGNLVNGTTITRYDAAELDRLEYFHIKLARHDVIYAEGAGCETLLEVDESATNFAEYLRQYGVAAAEATPVLPRIEYGYRRGELKSHFRSAMAPWIDYRQPADIIRDKLDMRAIALSREPEFV
jgi:Hint domain